MEKRGVAHGLFGSNAPEAAVKAAISPIRAAIGTPSGLEIAVTKAPAHVKHPSGVPLYQIQSIYPGKSNRKAADEAAAVLNQAYQSSLYDTKEPFYGQILYEMANGSYNSRN